MKKTVRTVFAAALACLILSAAAYAGGKKNVIFFIADGTGPETMGLLMEYARYAPNSPYADRTSSLEKIYNESKLGIMFNALPHSIVTDSAAAATQMATGKTTLPESIGVDVARKPAQSLLEVAQQKGMATGIITDVYVLDATPAGFVAHQNHRKMYDAIARDMLKTKPDVVLGGGLGYFLTPQGLNSGKYDNVLKKVPYLKEVKPKSKDEALFEDLLKSGYPVVFNKKDLSYAKSDKLFGLFADEAMPFAIKRDGKAPTLTDMTKKALEILSKDKDGFFLMVEAGSIDWLAHERDAAAVLQELLEFDDTLSYVQNWMKDNPDTLLIVTTDHDTSGLTFAYRHIDGDEYTSKSPLAKSGKTDYIGLEVLDTLAARKNFFFDVKQKYNALPADKKTDAAIKKIMKDDLGFHGPFDYLDGVTDIDEAFKEASKRQGVVWSTGNHTAAPLFVGFYGDNKEVEGGVLHNTDLHDRILDFIDSD